MRSFAGVRRAQKGINGNTPNAKDRLTKGHAGICQHTTQFQSKCKAPAKRMLMYHSISECRTRANSQWPEASRDRWESYAQSV